MKKWESKLIKDSDEEKASLQKSISITSALLTEKDVEPEKLRNEVTVLRRKNVSFKSLQGLEPDKVELELNVKNLELQLKENKWLLSSSSGITDTEAEEEVRAQESQVLQTEKDRCCFYVESKKKKKATTRKNSPRRNPASSVTYGTALISRTQRIVPPRPRCLRTLPTPHTTAVRVRNAHTVKSARCLGTGLLTAVMTRPSDEASHPELGSLRCASM